jgi:MFS family permease
METAEQQRQTGVWAAEEGKQGKDDGVVPESQLDDKEIAALGQRRPATLSSALEEVGFVTSVVFSMMMSEYFISGFNIVLPAVAESLHIPESARTWPAAVPNLTTAIFLLPFARLCDQYGGRVVFLSGHVWLLVWSIVGGFSRNSTMMIACRALQGVGSAAFMPAGIAMLGQTYRPGPRKNLVFSIYGAFACMGFYFGILIGAVASELLDWRWYFWIGAMLVFVLLAIGYPSIPSCLGKGDPNAHTDWWGTLTIVPGLALVCFAITEGGHAPDSWATPYIFVTFIVGCLLLFAAVYTQGWVSEQPLLPAELFRPKYMKRILASIFCSFGIFGLFLLYASF